MLRTMMTKRPAGTLKKRMRPEESVTPRTDEPAKFTSAPTIGRRFESATAPMTTAVAFVAVCAFTPLAATRAASAKSLVVVITLRNDGFLRLEAHDPQAAVQVVHERQPILH